MSERCEPDKQLPLLCAFPHAQFHPQLTFALPKDTDEYGNPLIGHAYWTTIMHDKKIASEGVLFLPPPENDQSHLIIFIPGMPGEGFCPYVQKRFVNPLMNKKGASCLVLRHLGTKLECVDGQKYGLLPERTRRGHLLHQDNLGEQKSYNVHELVDEVTEALSALGPSFKRITLVGHSAGVLGSALALQNVPKDIQDKVGHFISLAGLVGGIDNLRWWFRNRLIFSFYLSHCQRFIRLKSPDINIKELQEMFRILFTQKLPSNVMPIFVHAHQDELIHPSATRYYHDYNERGLHIIDHTQTPPYHKLSNVRSETLLRLLDIHHPHCKHTVSLYRKEPKK